MSAPKSIFDCKSTKDFEKVATRQGGNVCHGNRHDTAYLDGRGEAVLPRHAGELGKGMQWSIHRVMLALGFWVLCLACPCALIALALH